MNCFMNDCLADIECQVSISMRLNNMMNCLASKH
jgi:hypothetical protein